MKSGSAKDSVDSSSPPSLKTEVASEHGPIYRQLAERLSRDIIEGRLRPGERLPTEAEFGELYGVSRITIRQALALLAHEGLVERFPGKGSFVTERSKGKAWEMRSISDLVQLGSEVQTEIISWGLVKPTLEAGIFLKTSEPVYRLRAVRSQEGLPVLYAENYLKPNLGIRLSREDLRSHTLVDLLLNHLAIDVGEASEEIEAGLADEALANRLAIEPGKPVLIQHIDLFDKDGTPLQTGTGWWRSDRFTRKYVLRQRS